MKSIVIFFCFLSSLGSIHETIGQRRVLFAVSNAEFYGQSDIRTANHFGEIVFAYDVFRKANYQIDFVSPKGGSVPIGYINSDSLLQHYLHDQAFMKLLEHTKEASQVRAADYDAIYYPGGGAAMFGVPENKALQEIAAFIYERNGVVSTVCHGTAGIANVRLSNGKYLVEGKKVNGFPDLFENKNRAYFKEFPFSIQDQIEAHGGEFTFSEKGWDGYLELDGHLITGQDPTSARLVAKAVVNRLATHQNSSVQPEQIDEIFSEFDRQDHPAVATVVLNQGKIVYQKAFGSIELDNLTPASVDTRFQLGGLSKQFTAFAVLLLQEQGRLSLTDDIRIYLPQLPAFPQTITIDHLMTMTSGLPDFWALKNIAGWHRDDVFTQEQAMALITKSAPSFAPGEDYIYSNTDLLLMAEIVAKVSGMSFGAYMKEQVFDPLGMMNTTIKEDFEQYIPHIAQSYESSENGFRPSPLNYGIAGPTNVYSTVADLAKWELNLQNPIVGSKALVDQLYTPSTLNNGNTMNPLFGQLTYGQQLYHRERGIMEVYQTGSLGGYASAIFKFVDHDFTVIVLSSGIPYSGYLGMQTANLFLREFFQEPEMIDYQNLPTASLSHQQLQKHIGRYWNDRAGYSRGIELRNDTLRYVRGDGRASALLPLSENEFQMFVPGDEKIIVSFDGTDDEKNMSFTFGESDPIVSTLISEAPQNQDLDTYTGTYYCPSLNVVYEIKADEEILIAHNLRAGAITLKTVMGNLFEGDRWFFPSVKFDAQGFVLRSEEVPELRFQKLSNQVYNF